ncbi:MAG: sensor histidine kinase [Bergeyella sp.]
MKKLPPILAAFLIFCISMNGQTPSQSNVSDKILSQAKEDKKSVDALIKFGMKNQDSKPELAVQAYKKAFFISSKINYPEGKLNFYRSYTDLLSRKGKLDSVKLLNEKALALSTTMKDSLEIAFSLLNIGGAYMSTNEYEEAYDYLYKGYNIYSKLGDGKKEAQILNVLQQLSYFMHNYEQGIRLGLQAEKKSGELNSFDKASIYNNLAINYTAINDFEKAALYLNRSYEIGKKENNKVLKGLYFMNMADIDFHRGNFKNIKQLLDQSKNMFSEFGESEYTGLIDWGYAIYYLSQKDYDLSKKHAESALKTAQKVNSKALRLKALNTLSQIEFASQNMDSGFSYAKQAQQLNDSILNQSVTRKSAYYEKQFETSKKETQIKLQQTQIERKNILNYILIGSTLALLLIIFLSYRNYNTRKKLQLQRISELEIEQQLLATQSMLKGQDEERSRLAKDLHDGLGGLLSGVKLQLGAMKGNLILSEENGKSFDRTLLKLDESINEMRRVAHNMMPESLLKSGLKQAILDYCDSISEKQPFVINCELHGIDEKMSSATEIIIYRIIQELINNAIKHASATQILVQIFRHDNHEIFITVEDNGKGFDPEKTNLTKSDGMRNVQSRINYLKGTMDIKSEPGKGTSVFIECKEENYG